MPALLMPFMLAMLLLTSPVSADDWEQVRDAEARTDVAVYVKPVADNPLNAFMGVVEVPYSMLRIMAVLGDIDRFPEWVYQCDRAEMRPEEWGRDIVHIRIKGIWPVSDRDVVTRSTIKQDPETGTITLHSVHANDILPPQDGYVRLPDLDNRFILEPLDDGWTRITFRTFVDPGGYIPAWLANLVATRAPTTTLTKMQNLLAEDRYELSSTAELPLQFPELENLRFPSLK
jgi:hypothetical protein